MTTTTDFDDQLGTHYDVVVIGGGAAGLNGALMLARSRRSVVVIDAGAPRNAPASGVHGMLGHDGIAPAELVRRGRAEVRGYGGHVVRGDVVAADRAGDEFVVTLADGRSATARRLLVTTGVVDELAPVAGLVERWGRDVVHCPYCHGWEVRDQRIGILATAAHAVHQALMFRQLSADVVVFADAVRFDDDQLAQLSARDIPVVEGAVTGLRIEDDKITGVQLDDGRTVERDVVAVQSRLRTRADFLSGLGLELVEHPMGVGTYLPVEFGGKTAVPGIWAAGNVSDPMLQVGASAAAGAAAGAMINGDLVMAETSAAVAERGRQAQAPVTV